MECYLIIMHMIFYAITSFLTSQLLHNRKFIKWYLASGDVIIWGSATCTMLVLTTSKAGSLQCSNILSCKLFRLATECTREQTSRGHPLMQPQGTTITPEDIALVTLTTQLTAEGRGVEIRYTRGKLTLKHNWT